MKPQEIYQRVLLFQLIVVLAFVALVAQLWHIQILVGTDYEQLGRENRVRLETIDAPRGVIYDRNGHILVRNRPSFRATLMPARFIEGNWQSWDAARWNEVARNLANIADVLNMPFSKERAGQALRNAFYSATGTMLLEDIDRLCQKGKLNDCISEAYQTAPYRPVTIQLDLPREVAFRIMENSINLPGLSVVSGSQREYIEGSSFSHILGYQTRISREQLDRQTRFTTNPYLPTDKVGTAGIEAGYEKMLRGTKGVRLVEQNVLGQKIRIIQEDPATPGHNLFLTLDSDLQKYVAKVLKEGMDSVDSEEGVAIVMNPNNGQILSMVSLPTFDNNLFTGRIDPDIYQKLSQDPDKPMLNRAISGVYPPGSIFKIVPAAGGLAEGVIDRNITVNCEGSIYLPNQFVKDNPGLAEQYGQKFVCWNRRGHGDENVVDALAHSCDVFFYVVGGGHPDEFSGLGIDNLSKWASAFGLGQKTRIRLPGEATGLVPTSRWKRLTWQAPWLTGDSYNMSIGQGFLLVTPLQMANAISAVANGGTLYEPQLVYQMQDPEGRVVESFEPRVLRRMDIPGQHLDTVATGLRGAVAREDGTARLVFEDAPYAAAGKTGTAEYCPVIEREDGTLDCKLTPEGYQTTHAWFTAYAPYNNPEIAVVVFVHGNDETVIEGSAVAAPIARKIMDYYFSGGQPNPTPTTKPEVRANTQPPAGAASTAPPTVTNGSSLPTLPTQHLPGDNRSPALLPGWMEGRVEEMIRPLPVRP